MRSHLENALFLVWCIMMGGSAINGAVPASQPATAASGRAGEGALDRFELRLELREDRVAAGRAIDLALILKNRSQEKLAFFDEHPERDFDSVVRDPKGESAPPTAYFERHVAPLKRSPVHVGRREVAVDPGLSLRYAYRVNRSSDMTLAGTYHIQASRAIHMRDGRQIEVESNVVTVEVVDPEEGAK